MPPALAQLCRRASARRDARSRGRIVFHCAHRAYGVGMLDVADVVAADREIAARGRGAGAHAFLVGTVSHCHGALRRIVVR